MTDDFSQTPAIKHSNIALRDTVIHVAEAGEGPVLLFLHGWPEFWLTWLPLINRLHGSFRLIAPDLRGFGDSAKSPEARSDVGGDCHVEDMAALLGALGVDRVTVVGHDVGAFIGQGLARLYPDLVERLFFFNCPTPSIGTRWVRDGHVNQIWYHSFHQLELAEKMVGMSRESCSLYFRHFLQHWSHQKDAFDPVFELWIDNFLKPGNLRGGFDWYRSLNAARTASISGHPGVPLGISHPTRIFWGRHDPIVKSEWAAFIPDHFSNATIGFCETAGHFVHVESPDEAAAELIAFCRSSTVSKETD